MHDKFPPVIKPFPTDAQIRAQVDRIIEPADQKAIHAFCELMTTVASPEGGEEEYRCAEVAAYHAFMYTPEFQSAFRRFVGWPVFAEGDETAAPIIQFDEPGLTPAEEEEGEERPRQQQGDELPN